MSRRLAWIGLTCACLGRAPAADLPESPPTPPAATTNALTLAAACIERGEETAALAYLARYVAEHPTHANVRAYLAELLWRRERFAESRAEFERFLSDAQLAAAEPGRLIHGHTRLMAIAEKGGDAYAEHLNRGVGMYLLAGRDPAAAEALLCKAAGELTLAQREKPDEARPSWYLYLVWSRLGQFTPARAGLRRAARLAALSGLTPAERGDLALADAADRPRP